MVKQGIPEKVVWLCEVCNKELKSEHALDGHRRACKVRKNEAQVTPNMGQANLSHRAMENEAHESSDLIQDKAQLAQAEAHVSGLKNGIIQGVSVLDTPTPAQNPRGWHYLFPRKVESPEMAQADLGHRVAHKNDTHPQALTPAPKKPKVGLKETRTTTALPTPPEKNKAYEPSSQTNEPKTNKVQEDLAGLQGEIAKLKDEMAQVKTQRNQSTLEVERATKTESKAEKIETKKRPWYNDWGIWFDGEE